MNNNFDLEEATRSYWSINRIVAGRDKPSTRWTTTDALHLLSHSLGAMNPERPLWAQMCDLQMAIIHGRPRTVRTTTAIDKNKDNLVQLRVYEHTPVPTYNPEVATEAN